MCIFMLTLHRFEPFQGLHVRLDGLHVIVQLVDPFLVIPTDTRMMLLVPYLESMYASGELVLLAQVRIPASMKRQQRVRRTNELTSRFAVSLLKSMRDASFASCLLRGWSPWLKCVEAVVAVVTELTSLDWDDESSPSGWDPMSEFEYEGTELPPSSSGWSMLAVGRTTSSTRAYLSKHGHGTYVVGIVRGRHVYMCACAACACVRVQTARMLRWSNSRIPTF